MGGTEIQWSTESTLDFWTTAHSPAFLTKAENIVQTTALAWAGRSCTAATAGHRRCEHDLGCFTAQSIWSVYFCQPHICRKEGDPKLPWNVFRNGEEAFIVNFSCLGIVPNSIWRQIIDLSRLRLDLNWKQLFDTENIYQKYFNDYWQDILKAIKIFLKLSDEVYHRMALCLIKKGLISI